VIVGETMDPVVFSSAASFSDIQKLFSNDNVIPTTLRSNGNVFYDIQDLGPSTFNPALDPVCDHIQVAPLGGNFANFHTSPIGTRSCVIDVYNHRCQLLYSLQIRDSRHVFFSYLHNDDLAVVSDRGVGIIYSGFAEGKTFSITPVPVLMACCFSSEGCACLTGDGALIYVENYSAHRVVHTFDCIERPLAMEIVPGSNPITILIILASGSLLVASESAVYEVDFGEPLLSLSLSSKYTKIAFITKTYRAFVTDIKLSRILEECQFAAEDLEQWSGLSWVGDSIPLVSFRDAVFLAARDPASCMWVLDGQSFVFTEDNSALILNTGGIHRIFAVPETVHEFFCDSESSQFCQLFDLRQSSPPIKQLSRMNIDRCVRNCLTAAKFFQPKDIQLFFLNAANFGNSFTRCALHREVESAVAKIQILNVLRERCGLLMTPDQLDAIDPILLIDRLCFQSHHFVAAHICRLLSRADLLVKIGRSFVDSVLAQTTDDRACLNQLDSACFIDPAEAAIIAIRRDRHGIATEFISRNSDFAQNARVYSEMKQWEKAFQFAELSLDQNVVYRVVLAAISDTNSFTYFCRSAPALYLGILHPEIVANQVMLRVLHLSSRDDIDCRSRFGIARFDPPQFLPSTVLLSELKDFAQKHYDETGDRSLQRMSLNQMLCEFSGSNAKEKRNELVKTTRMGEQRSYVISLRHYARTNRWQALKDLGAQDECSKLWPLCVELCRVYGSQNVVNEFCEAANANRKIFTQRLVVSESTSPAGKKLESGLFK
jgi:hypothetical protein